MDRVDAQHVPGGHLLAGGGGGSVGHGEAIEPEDDPRDGAQLEHPGRGFSKDIGGIESRKGDQETSSDPADGSRYPDPGELLLGIVHLVEAQGV